MSCKKNFIKHKKQTKKQQQWGNVIKQNEGDDSGSATAEHMQGHLIKAYLQIWPSIYIYKYNIWVSQLKCV